MIDGVRHLVQWTRGFMFAAWCSPTDDYAAADFVGHGCHPSNSPAAAMVFEAALSNCEGCLRKRSLALNQVKPLPLAAAVQRVTERRGYTKDCAACGQPHVDLVIHPDSVDDEGRVTATCPTHNLLVPVIAHT